MRISLLLAAVFAATLFVKPASAAIYKSEPQAALRGFTYDGGTITTSPGFIGTVTDTSFLTAWSLSFSDQNTSYTLDQTNSTASYRNSAGNNLLVTQTTIEWPQPVGPPFEDRLIFEQGSVKITFRGGSTDFPQTDIFMETSLIDSSSTGFRPIVATLVPEPTSALFLCGTGALACLRRRRRVA